METLPQTLSRDVQRTGLPAPLTRSDGISERYNIHMAFPLRLSCLFDLDNDGSTSFLLENGVQFRKAED